MSKKRSLPKNVLTTLALAGMLLGAATPAMAAQGDFYDLTTSKHYSVATLTAADKAAMNAAYNNGNSFVKEQAGGKYLSYNGAYALFSQLMLDGKTSAEALTAVNADATLHPTINPGDFTEVAQGLAVESVSAINAKTIQVTFNKTVDTTTVLTAGNGTALKAAVAFAPVSPAISAGTLTGSFDATNKVLTVTAQSGAFSFNGQYVLTVTPAVTDADGKAITAYSGIVTDTDTVRPTATLSYPSNGVARVTFTEPLNVANAAAVEAAMTITAPSGAATVTPAGLVTLAADNSYVDIATSTFTADKDYTVTLLGLKDYAGNIISANPTTLTVRNSVVDNVAPTVTGITVTDDTHFTIQFSEALSGAPTITSSVGAATCTPTVDATDKTKYNVIVTGGTAGIQTITVAAGYTDLSTNAGAVWSKLVDLKADTKAPTYVSSEVKTIGADQYLLVKYNENVTLGAGPNALAGTYVDANSITQTFTTILATDASQYLIAPATTTDTIKIKITGLAAGAYTATVDGALVTDVATTPNPAAAQKVTFTVGATVDATTVPVPTVADVQLADINKVKVTFNTDVTAATALNVANYAVEGQNVFSSAIFSGNSRTVVLTLKPNVITLPGDRVFTISNVTSAGGKVMAAFSGTSTFKENVAPTIASAKLTNATTITVTFSENVTAAGTADYEYYVDGVKQAAVVNSAAAGVKTVTITVPTITDLTKNYQIKYVGTDVVDANANAAAASALVTVTQ